MDTKIEVEYLLLQEIDIDEVVTFYNSIYNSSRNVSRFIWEFKNSPAGEAIYVIAKDKALNKIVGSQSAIPIIMQFHDGQQILTAKSEDTLVDPKYRGLNIFENMYKILIYECKLRGVKFIWGFTSAKKPFTKLGFEIPFSHSQSLLIFNPLNSYNYLSKLNLHNNFISKSKILGLVVLSSFNRIIAKLFFSKIQELEYFIDNEFDIINDNDLRNLESGESTSFYIKKDKKFLKWRISNNPYALNTLTIFFKINSDIVSTISFSSNQKGVWFILNEMYHNRLTDNLKELIILKGIDILRSSYSEVDLIRNWEFRNNKFTKMNRITKRNCGFTILNIGISFVWLPTDEKNKVNLNNIILSRLAAQGMT